MERQIKYKVLENKLKSPFQDFNYRSGKEYHCADFCADNDIECAPGFYATDIEGLPFAFRPDKYVWECEVWGREVKYDIYKWRFENIRIVRKLSRLEIIEKAKIFEKKCEYFLAEVLFPINPLLLKQQKVTQQATALFKEWISVRDSVGASVGDSVRDSVGDSVRDSVRDSVWASVWASVRDSVGASVRDSVGAYISSLFPNIKKWKYIDHEPGVNPFQPCIDLWRSGFVPSYDGKTWRLHAGVKADVVYEYKA